MDQNWSYMLGEIAATTRATHQIASENRMDIKDIRQDVNSMDRRLTRVESLKAPAWEKRLKGLLIYLLPFGLVAMTGSWERAIELLKALR